MFLTRILIDKRGETIRKLKLWDSYAWHQALWHAFPQRDGQARNFLFRIDDQRSRFQALMLSESVPVRQPWNVENWETKQVRSDFLSGKDYRFQLKANPTLKKTYANGKKRRIGLYQEELLQNWILRKSEENGFIIDEKSLRIGGPMDTTFWIPGKKMKGKHVSVDFQGMLQVMDRSKFEDAFCQGIGSAKAYGYGLLMLQPVL